MHDLMPVAVLDGADDLLEEAACFILGHLRKEWESES